MSCWEDWSQRPEPSKFPSVCMYMYACMYVCMIVYVCIIKISVCYVFIYVCMYACMHICMYACMYVFIIAAGGVELSIYTYVCMHLCMYAGAVTSRPAVCMCMYGCMHSYVCVCVCVCVCVSVCLSVCARARMHVIYTCMHVYVCVYTRARVSLFSRAQCMWCVCMYVCMLISEHPSVIVSVCMYVIIYNARSLYIMHVRMRACVHACMHVCDVCGEYVCMLISKYTSFNCVSMHFSIYDARMYVCVSSMHSCIHANTYVRVYIVSMHCSTHHRTLPWRWGKNHRWSRQRRPFSKRSFFSWSASCLQSRRFQRGRSGCGYAVCTLIILEGTSILKCLTEAKTIHFHKVGSLRKMAFSIWCLRMLPTLAHVLWERSKLKKNKGAFKKNSQIIDQNWPRPDCQAERLHRVWGQPIVRWTEWRFPCVFFFQAFAPRLRAFVVKTIGQFRWTHKGSVKTGTVSPKCPA